MSDQACVLLFGIDETASAVARMLLLSGYAVALHQAAPPTILRRKMAFADDAQTPGERRERIKSHAELTIALGPGAIAGVDCDLVIETFGPDLGATIRSGAARSPLCNERNKMLEDAHFAVALEAGIFATGRIIGETVAANEPLGIIGSTPVVSPVAGRIRGLQRNGRAVVAGAAVADIATKATTQVSGIDKTDQLIARGVVFAIEMELAGWTPVSFDGFR